MHGITRSKAWMLCCMVGALSIFLFDDVSFAKDRSKSKSSQTTNQKIKVKAVIEPWAGAPEPLTYGEAEHEKESNTKKGKTTINKDKFEAQVKIPVPSTALGINTADDAAIADVHLTVSRGQDDIATCWLEFNGFESDDHHSSRFESSSFDDNDDDNDDDDDDDSNGGQLYAEYKVEVSKKRNSVRESDGNCAGVVPDAQAGDDATVEVNGTDALDGIFVQSGS